MGWLRGYFTNFHERFCVNREQLGLGVRGSLFDELFPSGVIYGYNDTLKVTS